MLANGNDTSAGSRGDGVLTRLLLAGVVTAGLGCVASAADMAVAPGPNGYPPPMVPTPYPYYDWTGVYLGPNVGGAWASQNGVATTDAISGVAVAATTPTDHWNWGFGGGGQVGGNWFFAPNFIVGAEADFDAMTSNGTVSYADGSTQADKTRFVSTARARIGLTADRFLWYVTGGFAWAQNQITRTQITGTVNGAGPGTVESLTINSIGYAAGTGLEYAIASHWTVRFELLMVELGGENYTFPVSARSTTTASETIGQLRFGVTYKFGGGDVVAPISARD